ncbi:MAG TPA: galactokinase [Planctomycetota bacterium]|jgi:D-glycero-alpha-D-manno-heptose-7-phosphate kinase
MIITRTPFRVTLGGGGTDLPSYYEKHGGFIFAMGINQYMYVTIHQSSVDRRVVLQYSRTEVVDHVKEIKHELAREALLRHGIEAAVTIASQADLPAQSGMGSSSSYLVGLLAGLHAYRRDYVTVQALAEEACDIELNVLKKGIGKQDQYMAAFGGLTVLEIAKDGTVKVECLRLPGWIYAELLANTHIYFIGNSRSAEAVLSQQNEAMKQAGGAARQTVEESLTHIKDLGYRILSAVKEGRLDDFGRMLDEHWQHKKRMSEKISLPHIDKLYDHAKQEFGVLGGKIIGAGGGGCLMLYCPKEHQRLARFMQANKMPRLDYSVAFEGAKVVTDVYASKNMSLSHTYDPENLTRM